MKDDLKASRPCITQGVRQQKGASPSKARRQKGVSPSKARHQILNIFIIHIEFKSYVPSALKYYNEVFFNVFHEEIRSIKLFQIRLTWFILH